jgi:hypothetical protein
MGLSVSHRIDLAFEEEEEEEKEDLCGDGEKQKKNCNNMHRRRTLRSRNTQKRGTLPIPKPQNAHYAAGISH